MNRVWVVAAVPFVLMTAMLYGFWASPRWADTASPAACVAILAGALVTGLCVLVFVLARWRRGDRELKRADILAATVLASLDVLIPSTLALLVWLLIRSLRNNGGILMF